MAGGTRNSNSAMSLSNVLDTLGTEGVVAGEKLGVCVDVQTHSTLQSLALAVLTDTCGHRLWCAGSAVLSGRHCVTVSPVLTDTSCGHRLWCAGSAVLSGRHCVTVSPVLIDTSCGHRL